MRKMNLLLLILVFIMSSCTSLEQESSEKETEALILVFLDKIYTIDDKQEYLNEMNKMIEQLSKGQGYNWGYDEICSENGLKTVIGNRMHTMYREAAVLKNFTMHIDDLEYKMTYKKEADGTILNEFETKVYEYSVSLLLEYENGDKQTIEEDGAINVKYIDGSWKVDGFRIDAFNDIWKETI